MSAEAVQKRGRPKKVVVEDGVPSSSVAAPPKTAKKGTAKTATTKTAYSKSNASVAKTKAKASLTPVEQKVKAVAPTKTANTSATKAKTAVSKAVSESIILQELVALDASKHSKRSSGTIEKVESVAVAIDVPTPTARKLEMKEPLPPEPPVQIATFTIPSQQSTTMPTNLSTPLLYAHVPSASIFQQAAYMSTKTTKAPQNPSKASTSENPPTRLPVKNYMSPKEFNKFAVEELSSRRGPGSGAEATRHAQARAEVPASGRPLSYKSTARRVTAIMCAMPIVIVTSYYLYQRLFLGVEPKQFPRFPTTTSSQPHPSAKEGESGT